MRKILPLLMVVAALGAAADTGTCVFSEAVTLRGPGLSPYDCGKAILKFAVPEAMRGKTVTSATLHLYSNNLSAPSIPISIRSTTGAWAKTDAYAALDALTLSAEIAAFTVPSSFPGWSANDVKGDAAKGMQQALTSSAETVTFVLYWSAADAPTASIPDAAYVGEFGMGGAWNFTLSAPNAPYVEVTYTDGATPAAPAVKSATVGVLSL